MSNAHVPVLLEPVLEGLAIKEDGILSLIHIYAADE